MTLLETFVVISACRIVAAKKVFEIGTFRGSTTLNLALNAPEDAEVLTLDLDEELARQAEQHPVDAELTQVHLKSRIDLDFLGSPVSNKIQPLIGNSIDFDFRKWRESIDVVLIDGGHDLATVKADTDNAFEIVSREKASCILWHDYKNPEYQELTSYLDGLAATSDVFHVEDTMLCIWFNDPNGSIKRKLLGTSKF